MSNPPSKSPSPPPKTALQEMRERWIRADKRFTACNKELEKVHETLYLESRHRLSCIDELYQTQRELRAVKNELRAVNGELRACQRRLAQIGAPVAGGTRKTRRRRKNKRRRRTRRK